MKNQVDMDNQAAGRKSCDAELTANLQDDYSSDTNSTSFFDVRQISTDMDVLEQRTREEYVTPTSEFLVDMTLHLLDNGGDIPIGTFRSEDKAWGKLTDEQEAPKSILIIGKSGSGKTTLLLKTAHYWATYQSETLRKFKCLLFLNLNQLLDEEDLEVVLTNEIARYYNQTTTTLSLNMWVEDVSQNFLLMLDGYEDLTPVGQQKLKKFLWENRTFTIVVTSTQVSDRELCDGFQRKLLIGELGETSMDRLIEMSCNNNNSTLVKETLSRYKSLAGLISKSPLFVRAFCRTVELGGTSKTTKCSELCSKLVFSVLKHRACMDNLNVSDHILRKNISELGKLASEFVLKEEYVLPGSELYALFPEHLDLIVKSGIIDPCSKSPGYYKMTDKIIVSSLAVKFYNLNLHHFLLSLDRESIANYYKFHNTVTVLVEQEGQVTILLGFAVDLSLFIMCKEQTIEWIIETSEDSEIRQLKCLISFKVFLNEEKLTTILRVQNAILPVLAWASSPDIQSSIRKRLILVAALNDFIQARYVQKICSLSSCLAIAPTFFLVTRCLSFRSHFSLVRGNFKSYAVLLVGAFLSTSPFAAISLLHWRLSSHFRYASLESAVFLRAGVIFFGTSLLSLGYFYPFAELSQQKQRNFLTASLTTAAVITKEVSRELQTHIRWMFTYKVSKTLVLFLLVGSGGVLDQLQNISFSYLCVSMGKVLLDKITNYYLRKQLCISVIS